jgi:hypothetical protein
MLHLINPEEVEGAVVLDLVRDFRRVQVSRFPINVKFDVSGNMGSARFYDSRFPTHTIAMLWAESDKDGSKFWVLDSRLIHNERYRTSRRNQKHTKDLKKLLRYMRDYVKPLSAKEIAGSCKEVMSSRLGRWKHDAIDQMRNACNFDRDDVMQEIVRMKAVGYQPQTPMFAKLMEQGVALWEEAKRRQDRKVMQVHIFVNPDESIELFCDDKLGYGGINQGVTVYNSIDEAPMNIQQSLAMLKMLEEKTFVPEVGTKVNETNYWVEIHPE